MKQNKKQIYFKFVEFLKIIAVEIHNFYLSRNSIMKSAMFSFILGDIFNPRKENWQKKDSVLVDELAYNLLSQIICWLSPRNVEIGLVINWMNISPRW